MGNNQDNLRAYSALFSQNLRNGAATNSPRNLRIAQKKPITIPSIKQALKEKKKKEVKIVGEAEKSIMNASYTRSLEPRN